MRLARLAMLGLLAIAAAPAPTPASLERALAGRWMGTLGYRDYQSNAVSELAVKTEIRALADEVTVLRTSEFDEGPRKSPVIIASASLHDPAASTVTTATLRKGRAVEVSTERLRVATYADATHWTVVGEEDGSDDNKPAKLRVTEVRDGDTLTATKEVMPQGTAAWAFRNLTKLSRIGD